MYEVSKTTSNLSYLKTLYPKMVRLKNSYPFIDTGLDHTQTLSQVLLDDVDQPSSVRISSSSLLFSS